ncbi:FAD/NAD(P)-binding protein [Magnetospirillum moscoviense]|uniref:Ni/Fe hydrogenase subunit gamma n=1 Tax=Magnetospirillum moscoviense TaxID=1437059 RepID=A0A178MRC1_9PROT|nr:FAD/NAD(P)-binding protein [Magnetospirillum moscoviense]OAN51483.1 Ni/Fe hydrogenase subunit gamma [Magnetospirillum moscoviense]
MTAVPRDPMLPVLFRIEKVRRDLSDTFTMELVPEAGGEFSFKPGQFNMLYVFGVGEIPISISGDPGDRSVLVHTTRAVGAVSSALDSLKAGDQIGVRGPYGTAWPIESAYGQDVVFVAGGVGLAPLRPAIYHAMNNRERYGKVMVLYGARTPEDILFKKELERWRGRFDMDVLVTVDRATGKWSGNVGVVTNLVARGGFDPLHTTAFVCGPEVMMRYGASALEKKGVARDTIWISMERNMKCGVGLCGHCQWGSHFVCKDGPVFRYDSVADLFQVREL